MPKVSVIIPARDAEEHVEACVQSVFAQTMEDWEIVAVDDGSRDRTGAILAGFGERVRVLAGAGSGPAAARNLAARAATGEYVALLDADDVWQPQYLERQLEALEAARSRDARAALVACDAYYLDGGAVGPARFMERFPPPADPTLGELLRRNFVYVSALLPRAVGDEAGWFDAELFGTEDYDLWIRVVEAGHSIVILPEALGVYRVSPGSVSSQPARQARNLELVYAKALARGRLAAPDRRIAERMLRRTRAVRVVAEEWIESDAPLPRRLAKLTRHAPMLAATVVREPSSWAFWLRELRRR